MKKSWLSIGVCMLFLLGCGSSFVKDGKGNSNPDVHSYIADTENNRVLVKDCFYALDEDTTIMEEDGSKLSGEDLEIGMKVMAWSNGIAAESYPCQTKAVKLIVMNDGDSKKEQKAVQAILALADSLYEKPIILLDGKTSSDGNGFEAVLRVFHETDEEVNIYYDFKTEQASIH